MKRKEVKEVDNSLHIAQLLCQGLNQDLVVLLAIFPLLLYSCASASFSFFAYLLTVCLNPIKTHGPSQPCLILINFSLFPFLSFNSNFHHLDFHLDQ